MQIGRVLRGGKLRYWLTTAVLFSTATVISVCFRRYSPIMLEQKTITADKTNINSITNLPTEYHAIVYNRVPKCGSTTVVGVLKELSVRNNYKYMHSEIYDNYTPSIENIRRTVAAIRKSDLPVVYDRHFFWVNFTRHGLKNYTYINLIRHPVSQRISGYYYSTNVKEQSQIYNSNKTFDECIEERNPACLPEYSIILRMFCGRIPVCGERSRAAFHRAVDNLNKYYLLVGYQEDMELFFLVLEKLLPRVLAKALSTYKDMKENLRERKFGTYMMPSQKSIDILSQHLALDLEFYDYVKQRFYTKMNSLLN